MTTKPGWTTAIGVGDFGAAWKPVPADGAIEVNFNPVLMWTKGDWVNLNVVGPPADMNGHFVYFGTSEADVTAATYTDQRGVFMDVCDTNKYDPCWSGWPSKEKLAGNTTYYWKVDEANDQNVDKKWPGAVWNFTTLSGKSIDPYPDNNNTTGFYIDKPYLGWGPGLWVNSRVLSDSNGHNVYFGTSYADVVGATTSSGPPLYRGLQDPCTYPLSSLTGDYTLNKDTAYYWRIDEVNTIHLPNAVWTGYVWKFTMPNFYVVDDFNGYNSDTELKAKWEDGKYSSSGCTIGGSGPKGAVAIDLINKCMTFTYDNNGDPGGGNFTWNKYSEARLVYPADTYPDGVDWTASAVPDDGTPKFLSIRFKSTGTFAAGTGNEVNQINPRLDALYTLIQDTAGLRTGGTSNPASAGVPS
jgi:hypothetical protein